MSMSMYKSTNTKNQNSPGLGHGVLDHNCLLEGFWKFRIGPIEV